MKYKWEKNKKMKGQKENDEIPNSGAADENEDNVNNEKQMSRVEMILMISILIVNLLTG